MADLLKITTEFREKRVLGLCFPNSLKFDFIPIIFIIQLITQFGKNRKDLLF